MHLTVIGATGGVGRHVVDQARAAGHTVLAAVRNPANLHRELPHVTVDLAGADPETLRLAVKGSDAVISCLGPRARHEYGIVAPATKAIIAAMQDAGSRRIVTVSAAGVSTARTPSRRNPPRRERGAGWYNQYFATPLVRRALASHFVDVATMEDLLRASGLDWTAVRPPHLTDTPMTGRYRTALERNVRRGIRISRADVAHFILNALERPVTVGKAIAVAY